MASRTDTAGHTGPFDNPVTEHWGKAEVFSSASGTRTGNTSADSRMCYPLSQPGSLEYTDMYLEIIDREIPANF